MAWTYSDYVTYDYGATRLSRFRSHIQEVSDKISAEMSAGGRSRSTNALQSYLNSLLAREEQEVSSNKAAAGTRTVFTRARPRPTP